MKISRRDVVEVVFASNTKASHPVIVLSPEEINSEEESFLGVMITDSLYFDVNNDFSFPLDDSMFVKPLKEKSSKARLYLVNFLPNSSVVNKAKINEMKIDAFKQLIKDLNLKVFDINIS
ncbi:MAG: type II toxin-antitoxin system PemK/MazF family toxin [Bacteroidetes bacterium]|nr:type II toxin-antitoxin system PemK/MazF family toxin [Bacteroidota bacterium]